MSATEWVQVGELSDSFQHASNAPEASADLVGKNINLHMANGWVIRHSFLAVDVMEWEILDGPGKGQSQKESCRVTSLRDDIYLVDFSKGEEGATRGTLVFNFATGLCVCALSKLMEREECDVSTYARACQNQPLPNASSNIFVCGINRDVTDADTVPYTDELIGKRVHYRYSPAEKYEHYYLNSNFYVWHCLEGVEQGLCDTDQCYYIKIDDELYLFFWHEKIIPTVGTVMIDLKGKATTGKLFGYVGNDFGQIQAIPVGATIETILPA